MTIKNVKLENLGEHHDLHVQSNAFLLVDVFENFQNMWLALGLAWQADLKKTRVYLDLLTDTDMLLMAERGITRGVRHATHR